MTRFSSRLLLIVAIGLLPAIPNAGEVILKRESPGTQPWPESLPPLPPSLSGDKNSNASPENSAVLDAQDLANVMVETTNLSYRIAVYCKRPKSEIAYYRENEEKVKKFALAYLGNLGVRAAIDKRGAAYFKMALEHPKSRLCSEKSSGEVLAMWKNGLWKNFDNTIKAYPRP